VAVRSKPAGLTKKQRVIIKNTFLYIILIAFGILFMIPFLWMMSSSLKVSEQIFLFPPEWIPEPFVWKNYPEALKSMNFLPQLKNTLIYTFSTIIGSVLSSCLVAYGFARFEFSGRNFFFILMISTMFIPPQVTIIPTFIVFTFLGWVNTYKPLIIPAFFGVPFYIFLLRQFFMTIPKDLDEAAIIDGCGYLRIFTHIILPLSKPAITAIVIFRFVWTWNDFFGPLVYLNESKKYPLSLGLAMFRGIYSTEWNQLMAASLVVLLPCLVIYFFAQRYFIQGITLTGMKG